jgi:uncharacterized protein involved in exopolysaccharide biosynthesis
MKHLFEEI